MNINQMIKMFSRLFMRKIMNKGINSGIDYAARRGKDRDEMTPDEKQRARSARDIAKKAKKSARLLRRLGRF